MSILARGKNILFSTKHRYLSAWLRATFLYNPIVAPLVSMLVTGFQHPYERWVSAFVIGMVVTYVIIFASALVDFVIEPLLLKILRKPRVVHSREWWLSLSLITMPAGLYLGFKVNRWAYPFFGLVVNGPAKPDSADYRIGLLIGTAIATVFFVFRSSREAKERQRLNELKIKNIENERLQAQISALTAQMNPHLMFNALNTVAALVPTDPRKAEETIIQLSELYRGVLNSSRKLTHSLASELSICEAYLAVEKARFGERLRTCFIIDPEIDLQTTQIPALSLQPLIENAIKHGLSSRAAGGEVQISLSLTDDRLRILIEDDGVGFAAASTQASTRKGAGTGLKNCRERLKLHYGAAGNFQVLPRACGTAVLMTIPREQVQP